MNKLHSNLYGSIVYINRYTCTYLTPVTTTTTVTNPVELLLFALFCHFKPKDFISCL